MIKRYLMLAVLILLTAANTFADSGMKIPLDHSVYDAWKSVANFKISNDGKKVLYRINPQIGDSCLVLKDTDGKLVGKIPRGGKAYFSYTSDFLVCKVNQFRDTVRNLKLKKTKAEKLPKDSLAIWLFNEDKLLKFPRVKSFNIAEENSNWVLYQLEKPLPPKKDTSETVTDSTTTVPDSTKAKEKTPEVEEVKYEENKAETEKSEETAENKEEKSEEKEGDKDNKDKEKKPKKEGTKLIVFNPLTDKEFEFENVKDYTVSEKSTLIAFTRFIKDSTDSSYVFVFDLEQDKLTEVFYGNGVVKKLTLDNSGEYAAFIHSADTCKEDKIFNLYFWTQGNEKAEMIIDSATAGVPEGKTISENGKISFSDKSTRLFVGTADIPRQKPEDTLLAKEKYKVDIWSWHDGRLQTQQLHELSKDKKRTYLGIYNIAKNTYLQICDETLKKVHTTLKGEGEYALASNTLPYDLSATWEVPGYEDVYLVNMNNGERTLVLEKHQYSASLSKTGKYVIWYDYKDATWHSYSVETKKRVNLTKDINVNFYNELHDTPMEPESYGIAGWADDDKYVYIYDRYDIWKIDPTAKKKPACLTKNAGRENNTRFRYQRLDPEAEFIPDYGIMLSAFDYTSKDAGYYTIGSRGPTDKSTDYPQKLIMDNYQYYGITKAKNANVIIFKKGNYNEYVDLHSADIDFDNDVKLSDGNPQQDDYLWGTNELVKWIDLEGVEREGLLYKPDNFDPEKKYPMMVYFYERYSDGLNRHYVPKPTASIIYPNLYASNGYVVFIPDIHYTTGHPGKDAYNAIMSGTLAMIAKGFINKDKMGLQGQSWGGYQTAFLVTQTNLFAAGMAGAPVSNMTSAYGGIRWGSGLNRAFQYEVTQSRIGGTLWEKPELYIENSPLFFADRVETPLLIMHNDGDGAVPWYQGIELFNALRRLQKPVWLLNYNGDEHNLMKRPNRMDLSIRMMQFFDYYLKDTKAPEWLKHGVPALKKGKTDAYELVD